MSTNNIQPTPTSDEQADRLFTNYFHHHRPKSWRPAPRPWAAPVQPATVEQRDTMTKSRWALAASVALLLGGCWYLSGHLTNGKKANTINLESGEATPKHIKDLSKSKPKMP